MSRKALLPPATLLATARIIVLITGNHALMSALPPKADIERRDGNVCLVPIATLAQRADSLYSITSSARASSVGGIASPSGKERYLIGLGRRKADHSHTRSMRF